MNRTIYVVLWAMAALSCARGERSVLGAEIKLATDRPQPHAPEESIKLMQVPPGFRVEVVASEPYLADPVAIEFDARGRIFVAELHGYNLEGYWDIVELNKTGVLDRKVRRIDASEAAQQLAAKDQYGTVKLLEDTDGDGRIDRSWVWADRLPPCYGVVAARGGVVALCPPDVIFLADRDGDGKAEVHQKLYSAGDGPMWYRASNPRWNLDNWIYCDSARGASGFRFKPDGSRKEPVTGSGEFGQAATDWGDRFYCTQSQPARYAVPLPYRYLARNPYHPARADVESLIRYTQVYPISRPHPWRLKRSQDPAWVRFYGAQEATSNGYWTSACGPEIEQARLFPREYWNNYFICECAQNFIARNVLERDGAGYRIRCVSKDEQRRHEFLTSTETWFRPINLRIGPDGALYIVDMYREIIEDYSAIPRFLQQQYVESLVAGNRRGRIYRVVPEGTPSPSKFDLAAASTDELVRQLSNTNAWWRLTAQRLLIERGDRSAAALLATLVRESRTPQARLHALYTLDGLGTLPSELVEHALADPHFAVRTHALRLAERWLAQSSHLTDRVLSMVDDPDPAVRLQLALTLGASHEPRAVQALARLAQTHGHEKWMPDAILSSVAASAGELLGILLDEPDQVANAAGLLRPLCAVLGTRHKDEEIATALERLVASKGTASERNGGLTETQRVACLEGLADGLRRGRPQVLESPDGQRAVAALLTDRFERVRKLSVAVAGLVRVQQSRAFLKAVDAAANVALDEQRPLEDRLRAISLLQSAPFARLDPLADQLLDVRQPLPIQLAMVKAVAAADTPDVATRLLAHWRSSTPQMQQAVVEALLARKNRIPRLLDAIQQGKVPPSSLTAVHRIRLREYPDTTIRQRAQKLLVGRAGSEQRQRVLARYTAALAGPRDPEHGKVVFDKQCSSKCHRLQDQGFEVGPDLSSVVNRADETLVSDVLEPSQTITMGFQSYTVLTQDGRVFNGVLSAETATSVTLRKEQGVDQVILRRDIEQMVASPISMMPEELEKEVSPQDLADLIAYLRQALGPPLPAAVTLWDDDPQFSQRLDSGAGTARMIATDTFSGKLALVVTPPQRSSSRIPGWGFRITEKPGPGEFRYIRFAWKSPAGAGVMIELAANGAWPPADQPVRRYYSGRNTTSWAAVQIAPEAPRDWVVVTRDLYKAFGSFTLTGIAPTAMGGEALFDRIELLRTLDAVLKDRNPEPKEKDRPK